jgi:hypothetical protein
VRLPRAGLLKKVEIRSALTARGEEREQRAGSARSRFFPSIKETPGGNKLAGANVRAGVVVAAALRCDNSGMRNLRAKSRRQLTPTPKGNAVANRDDIVQWFIKSPL